MKKILAAVFCACAALSVSAQDLSDAQKAAAEAAVAIDNTPEAKKATPKPRYWKNSLSTKIDFGQTSLLNWVAGGYNNYSLRGYIDANANYAKGTLSWTNRLQLDYGFLYSADKPVLQKSDDRIYLESKFGYKLKDKLNITAEYNLKSQFTNTYDYPTPTSRADGSSLGEGEEYTAGDWRAARSVKSGFFSPAYTNLALGIDYKPLSWLTVNLAPLTGGVVIVDNPLLRPSYSQPLKKGVESGNLPLDPDGNVDYWAAYKAVKFEFGAQLKVDFKVNVNDNFKFSSQVVLFSNYLKKPLNMRVNWDNRIEWKMAKYFSMMLTTNLIYDDDIMIEKVEKDGTTTSHQRVQFKEALSFGFVYTIASKN